MTEKIRETESDYDAPDSRRSFLKKLGIIGLGAAAVAATGKAVEVKNESDRKDILAKMANAPTENMRVRPWGETPGEGEENDAITISDLRENAGWDADYEQEFGQVLSLKNPSGIVKDHTLQPGIYKVPVNRGEEAK